ncbi:Activator of stress response 1 [Metarhizium brunneum]|uniref:Activator of stress response 1 n=1 Tax=Metarhizium brunneum TaxID=500148 RepID=A0A7D5UYD6_9HYPO
MATEMAEDDAGALSVGDWQISDVPSPADSSKSDTEVDEKAGSDPNAPSQPIQKRRRVTRACDECRRKKIKCDGKQPCTHCSVYSYECTYDKPSNRRRNPAPQYIEALESRLQRAETLLRKFMPDVDLADPNLDPAIQQEFHNREQARAGAGKMRSAAAAAPDAGDAKLMTMIDSIGQLDLDDKGGWDFHGTSSGAVFLKRMKEQFRGLLGPVSKAPFLPRAERASGLSALDTPSPAAGASPFSSISAYPELPPKDVARKLCYYSLSCATCLVRIIHIPTFYEKFEQIYDRPIESLNQEETHFLGLVHAVIALGCMYNNLEDSNPTAGGYKTAIEEGLKYYRAAKSLLQDLADCRDIVSLQALLFMTLFLQATSNLSACYSFVGIALRSALRIGLHRHLEHEKIGVIEQEVRKRVFYVIRQMDIYVSTMLGFPLLLNIDDVDQPFPTEVDDEFITDTGIMPPPLGTPSFFEAFNAHTRLMEVLGKITKFVYPMHMQGQPAGKGDSGTTSCLISYGRIKEIEADLQTWYDRLPEMWRPSPDGPIEVVRVRHLLRFAYAHVQLVLYRPFLHYISPRHSHGTKVDELSYACAAAAVSVSRNIVHIGLEIRKQRVLSGPYWFMLYTEFYAVLSLVFYAIENPDKPGSQEVLADAHAGRQMIADLADKSLSADRVTKALKVLFDQLPERLEQARLARPAGNSRKRSAAGSKSGSISTTHAGASRTIPVARAEDFIRSRSGGLPGPFGAPNSRGSVDGSMGQSSDPSFHDIPFSGSMHDILPMDLSSRTTPDSTSNASSTHRHRFPSQPLNAHSIHNPVNKLDSLMFPSEDPFAYPNQPMMELGFQPKADAPGITMAAPNASFFFTGSFEEMGDQILGQPPPYMTPQQQHHPMGMAASMYDPHNMMALHSTQQQQQHNRQMQQQAMHQQQHQQQQGGGIFASFRRARADRQQERQIEQMFTQQGMQADWGSFFGSGRGGFQGM